MRQRVQKVSKIGKVITVGKNLELLIANFISFSAENVNEALTATKARSYLTYLFSSEVRTSL